jgi:hypothetical protein
MKRRNLVQTTGDPARPSELDPDSTGSIHVWSVDKGAAHTVVTFQHRRGATYAHRRAAIVAKLRELGGNGGMSSRADAEL